MGCGKKIGTISFQICFWLVRYFPHTPALQISYFSESECDRPHLVYQEHSRDAETDEGALNEGKKPNSSKSQRFYQKGRGMPKRSEREILKRTNFAKTFSTYRSHWDYEEEGFA